MISSKRIVSASILSFFLNSTPSSSTSLLASLSPFDTVQQQKKTLPAKPKYVLIKLEGFVYGIKPNFAKFFKSHFVAPQDPYEMTAHILFHQNEYNGAAAEYKILQRKLVIVKETLQGALTEGAQVLEGDSEEMCAFIKYCTVCFHSDLRVLDLYLKGDLLDLYVDLHEKALHLQSSKFSFIDYFYAKCSAYLRNNSSRRTHVSRLTSQEQMDLVVLSSIDPTHIPDPALDGTALKPVSFVHLTPYLATSEAGILPKINYQQLYLYFKMSVFSIK